MSTNSGFCKYFLNWIKLYKQVTAKTDPKIIRIISLFKNIAAIQPNHAITIDIPDIQLTAVLFGNQLNGGMMRAVADNRVISSFSINSPSITISNMPLYRVFGHTKNLFPVMKPLIWVLEANHGRKKFSTEFDKSSTELNKLQFNSNSIFFISLIFVDNAIKDP